MAAAPLADADMREYEMSKVIPNPTALRQLVITAVVAFFVGFVGVLVMWAWFLCRHQIKDMSWWQIFDMVMHTIHIITFAVIGGLLATLATTRAVSWLHVRLGMYECPFCRRAVRVSSMRCECDRSRPINSVEERALTRLSPTLHGQKKKEMNEKKVNNPNFI